MSAQIPEQPQSEQSALLADEIFLSVIVTSERATVLRELTLQAVEHFGQDRLWANNISVATSDGGSMVLASAEFALVAF
jgi:hypothetical protein